MAFIFLGPEVPFYVSSINSLFRLSTIIDLFGGMQPTKIKESVDIFRFFLQMSIIGLDGMSREKRVKKMEQNIFANIKQSKMVHATGFV